MIKLNIILLICNLLLINWNTYNDYENKFKINYPKEWSKKSINGITTFLSPKENSKDEFQENVNIMIQDLSAKPLNLNQYTELTKKQVIDNLGVSAIVSLKPVKLSGQEAKEFIYNMNYNGQNLRLKQYWLIKKNKAYLFTYTSLLIKYNQYNELATKTIQSLKLL